MRLAERYRDGWLMDSGVRPIARNAHVAQLVEHVLGKDEVTRSIRVVGSIPSFAWAAPFDQSNGRG